MKNRFLNQVGFTIVELLFVASIVGIVPITVYMEAAKHAKTASCFSNLRNIYMGLQMYEMDFERLPNAKFYPKTQKDPKSIANMLSSYIDDKRVFICPAMPAELAKNGLTYIWNDSYNNKFLASVRNRSLKWVMTEMSAVEPNIPPPHHGCYNILFFDGHIETVKEAVHLSPTPADLRKFLKDKFYTEKPKEEEEG